MKKIKKAEANLEALQRIFIVPEGEDSTLSKIESEISQNLMGFLRKHIVAEEMTPDEIQKNFSNIDIPEDPMFVSEHAQFLLKHVVSQSVHTSSPSFIGHMTSAIPYFMLPLAKIMMGLNQNTVKIETSKAFTPLENQVIGMLHHLVYENGGEFYRKWTHDRDHALGIMCSGGTIGNLAALWVARNQMLAPKNGFKGIYEDGIAAGMRAYDYDRLAVLVSKRGHYSLKKAVDILGLGRSNLVLVSTDTRHRMDASELRKTIARLREERTGIVAVVGIAGTTETGSVDPLGEIAEICEQNKIWFHVDGAWGGPTLFSAKHKATLKGIERADSVIMDAHKQLYCPMGAGVALFKNPKSLDAIETSASYIIRPGSRDLGKHTLEGGRPGMAMLVHSGLNIIGRKGYEMLIDMGIENAKAFSTMIQQQPDFELMTQPELNLLTYRYVPKNICARIKVENPEVQKQWNEQLNELTVAIQKQQRDAGRSFVSRTSFEMPQYDGANLNVFRVVLANPLTSKQILQEVLIEQREIAQVILKKQFRKLASL